MVLDRVVARAAFDYGSVPRAELHAHDLVAAKRDWGVATPISPKPSTNRSPTQAMSTASL